MTAEHRPLVVVADDFGLTPGVCRGVLEAHRDGIVTSTSALVVAPAFAAHAAAVRDSGIGVGLHVALVGEDPPLLGAREIPSLVDRRGRLDLSWRRFVARAALGRIDPDDVRREARAQLEALRGAGIEPTHVDTHQNVHLWPAVAEVVVALAQAEGPWPVRVPRTRRRDPRAAGVATLSRLLGRRVVAAGLPVTSASAGLDEAGRWDEASMAAAVLRLGYEATGAAELSAHPGADPDAERARYPWGYAWERERSALCSDQVRRAVTRAGFTLARHDEIALAPTTLGRPQAAVHALRPYREAGLRTRAHTLARWTTCPLPQVGRLLPPAGRVLDVGCGHGLLALELARSSEARTVHGVDVDADKVVAARRAAAAAGLADRVTFAVVEPTWRPAPAAWDALVVVDVAYLMGADAAGSAMGSWVAAVRPGGRLVVKEVAGSPAWKLRIARTQERIALRVGLTRGVTVDIVPVDALAEVAAAQGLDAWTVRLDRGWPHPHAAAVADRPA